MNPFLISAILTVVTATLLWFCQRGRQSSVVAYLLAGIIVGPSGLRLLSDSEGIEDIAEIGVILLLFFIGLDFNLSGLRQLMKLAVGGAALQVGITTVVIAVGCYLAGFGWIEGGIMGFALAMSSTAIIMKAYEDRGEADSASAKSCFTLSLGQDLSALLLVAALPLVLSGSGSSTGESPWLRLGVMIATLPILFLAVRWGLPRLFRAAAVARSQELFAIFGIAACILVAVLAQLLGASLTLGAFLAGLAFSGTPYVHQIRSDLATVKTLALGFFFVSIGMLMSLDYVTEHPLLILGGIAFVLVVKTLIAGFSLRVVGVPLSVAAAAGLALSNVGEFAFVVTQAVEDSLRQPGARDLQATWPRLEQALTTLTVLYMILAPTLVIFSNRFGRIVGRIGARLRPVREVGPGAAAASGPPELPAPVLPKAVVVGYGPVGQTLCRILEAFRVDPCIIDLHSSTVRELGAGGYRAVFGDAGQREVLIAAGIREASYLLVTVPDYRTRAQVIVMAHLLNPALHVISRARYMQERSGLEDAGANLVAYEEVEVAAALARMLLLDLGVPDADVHEELKTLRTEILRPQGFTSILRLHQTVALEHPIVPLEDPDSRDPGPGEPADGDRG